MRGSTLIDGLERIGKTTTAKEWCERNSGAARYVLVPATSDDISFYRAIAKALGVSSALSLKGVQMRERIEYVIQITRLMLVFDSAEYVWPQSNRREALPNRLNWILNALVDHGAPVALIANPQFTQDQQIVERKTLWRSERFRSVLTRRVVLPSEIGETDIRALALNYLPEATEKGISVITAYALTSAKFIAGIESVASSARARAEDEGREAVTTADIVKAIEEDVMPSDRAIESVMQPSCKRRARAQQIAREPIRADFIAAPEPTAGERLSSARAANVTTRRTDLDALGVPAGEP